MPTSAPPLRVRTCPPRIAPDGAQAWRSTSNDQELDIWLWDSVRGGPLRALRPIQPRDLLPVWTLDGQPGLLFGSSRGAGGRANLFTKAADGTGAATRLTEESPMCSASSSLSPDGTRLVFHENSPRGGIGT